MKQFCPGSITDCSLHGSSTAWRAPPAACCGRMPVLFSLPSFWPVPSCAAWPPTLFRTRAPNFTCTYLLHAHARSADALQFLRSHASQHTHDYSMTAFAAAYTAACLCHAVRLATHYPTSASLVSYAAIYLHAHACAAAAYLIPDLQSSNKFKLVGRSHQFDGGSTRIACSFSFAPFWKNSKPQSFR